MKKFLLSLVALLGVMNVSAQVTETDRSAYDDVIYAAPVTIIKGTTSFLLPINVKAHADFTATESTVKLPEGIVVNKDGGIDANRYDASKDVKLVTLMGNERVDGYQIATVIASQGVGADKETVYGFAAGDDVLGYIDIDVSALEEGEYEMVMKNATISGFLDGSADVTITDDIVTKLIVTSTLVLDENSTKLPESAENQDVLVKRTIKAGSWNTICLPFEMTEDQVKATFGDGVQIADFTGYEAINDLQGGGINQITVKFATGITSISANHPYILKLAENSEAISEFSLENVNIAPAENAVVTGSGTVSMIFNGAVIATQPAQTANFVGNYTVSTVPANKVFIRSNKFYYSTGATVLNGFRGYFDFSDVLTNKAASNVKVKVFIDDMETSVNGLNIEDTEGTVYTIDGKKMNNDVTKLPKGVYIIDGKKVAIK